jgi:hypothetical protein
LDLSAQLVPSSELTLVHFTLSWWLLRYPADVTRYERHLVRWWHLPPTDVRHFTVRELPLLVQSICVRNQNARLQVHHRVIEWRDAVYMLKVPDPPVSEAWPFETKCITRVLQPIWPSENWALLGYTTRPFGRACEVGWADLKRLFEAKFRDRDR